MKRKIREITDKKKRSFAETAGLFFTEKEKIQSSLCLR